MDALIQVTFFRFLVWFGSVRSISFLLGWWHWHWFKCINILNFFDFEIEKPTQRSITLNVRLDRLIVNCHSFLIRLFLYFFPFYLNKIKVDNIMTHSWEDDRKKWIYVCTLQCTHTIIKETICLFFSLLLFASLSTMPRIRFLLN